LNRFVLDTSVALAWCFEDESSSTADAIPDLLHPVGEVLLGWVTAEVVERQHCQRLSQSWGGSAQGEPQRHLPAQLGVLGPIDHTPPATPSFSRMR